MTEDNNKLSAKEFVEKWLEKSGSALELRVAREYRRRTIRVAHSRYYPVATPSGTSFRETDVVATFQARTPGSEAPALLLQHVVECKSGGENWVFYEFEDFHFDRDDMYLEMCRTFSRGVPASARIAGIHNARVFYHTKAPAYQVADTSKNNSIAYVAVQQVQSGVTGLIREMEQQRLTQAVHVIFIPVIVLAAPMFTVSLDQRGEAVVTPITRVMLLSRREDDHEKQTFVWVLHESEVPAFVDEAAVAADRLYWRGS